MNPNLGETGLKHDPLFSRLWKTRRNCLELLPHISTPSLYWHLFCPDYERSAPSRREGRRAKDQQVTGRWKLRDGPRDRSRPRRTKTIVNTLKGCTKTVVNTLKGRNFTVKIQHRGPFSYPDPEIYKIYDRLLKLAESLPSDSNLPFTVHHNLSARPLGGWRYPLTCLPFVLFLWLEWTTTFLIYYVYLCIHFADRILNRTHS